MSFILYYKASLFKEKKTLKVLIKGSKAGHNKLLIELLIIIVTLLI